VYGGIREIFSLHRQPASIKHTHQKNHIAASSDTSNECLPDAIINLPHATYPGFLLIVVGSPYYPSWRSTHTTITFSNGSDITCEFTIFHISTHNTKSSSSSRTRAVPRKVKIPTNHVPRDCRFCSKVNSPGTPLGSTHQRPFEYILAISRSRERPRRKTVLPFSSESKSVSESESDTDDSGVNSDTDNSGGFLVILVLIKRRLAKPNNHFNLSCTPGSSLINCCRDANLRRRKQEQQGGAAGLKQGSTQSKRKSPGMQPRSKRRRGLQQTAATRPPALRVPLR